MKRSWTNIKIFEPKILAMRAAGKMRREIADELGLNKIQIKNRINRHNKEADREEAGLSPKKTGVSLPSHCKNTNTRTQLLSPYITLRMAVGIFPAAFCV